MVKSEALACSPLASRYYSSTSSQPHRSSSPTRDDLPEVVAGRDGIPTSRHHDITTSRQLETIGPDEELPGSRWELRIKNTGRLFSFRPTAPDRTDLFSRLVFPTDLFFRPTCFSDLVFPTDLFFRRLPQSFTFTVVGYLSSTRRRGFP